MIVARSLTNADVISSIKNDLDQGPVAVFTYTHEPFARQMIDGFKPDAREARRAEKLLCGLAREEFLLGRAIVHSIVYQLSRKRVRLIQTAYGKPTADLSPAGLSDFSLSHSRGLVVCAVAANGRIGVDVEREMFKGENLPNQILSQREKSLLDKLPIAERSHFFGSIWRRKEAILKAAGVGLFGAPNDFCTLRWANGRICHEDVVYFLGTLWRVDCMMTPSGDEIVLVTDRT